MGLPQRRGIAIQVPWHGCCEENHGAFFDGELVDGQDIPMRGREEPVTLETNTLDMAYMAAVVVEPDSLLK